MSEFTDDTKAYFAWKKDVIKTEDHLPLAKIAWDAAIEYARRSTDPFEEVWNESRDWLRKESPTSKEFLRTIFNAGREHERKVNLGSGTNA